MAQLQEVFLFQPTNVPSCVMWFDAADPSTVIRSGTNVTQWNDKTGNGNTAVAGTATFPVYNVNTLNGFPTISMNAGNDYFLVNNNLTTTTYPSLCYFIVIRPAASQPNTSYAGILSTDSAGAYGRTLGFGGGSWQEEYYSNFVNITPYTANVWTVVSLQFVTTVSATLAVNGTTYAGIASGTGNNTTGFKIGSYNDSASYATFNANFDVAEIMVYGTNVSTAQRQQIEGYLAWKWGLQGSLPSNHPFKNYRPLANQPIPPQVPNMPIISQNTSVFNPASISGCQLWLDAGDPTSFSFNGPVITQWRDKSGNGRNATAGGAPVLQLNSINGLPSIFYDGVAGGNFTGSITITTTSIFAFAVFVSNMTSGSEGMRIISFSGPGCADWNCSTTMIAFLYNSNQIQTWRNSATTTNLTCPAQGSTILTTTYYDGSTAYNSLFGGTSSSAIGSSGSFNISNYNMTFGNVPMRGNLGEVIIYNSVLTTNQRQQIEGYLAWKWGVHSSLPANHPYRVQPVFPLPSRLMTTRGSLNSWLPTQLSGCQLWLDATDVNGNGTQPANGASISTWRDKSVSANHASIVASYTSPTYVANSLNGRPGVFFSNSVLSTQNPIQLGSFFGVCLTQQNATLFAGAGSIANNPWSPYYCIIRQVNPVGNALFLLSFTTGTPSYPNYITTSLNTNYIFAGTYDGVSQMVNTMNGSAPVSNSFVGGTPKTATATYIGGDWYNGSLNPSLFMLGPIYEIISYSGFINNTQRQQVEGYLAWKWGLQGSLPANHPYKLWPPSP